MHKASLQQTMLAKGAISRAPEERVGIPVAIGLRRAYGFPNWNSGLSGLCSKGCDCV